MHRILVGLLCAAVFAIQPTLSQAQETPASAKHNEPQGAAPEASARRQLTRATVPDLLALAVQETKLLPQEGATVMWRLSCDHDGNPYFSTTVRSEGEPVDIIARWDLKENRLIRYNPASARDLAGFSFLGGYGIAPDGGIYTPVVRPPEKKALPEVYLARFNKDGTFAENIRIEQDLWIIQLGVFPSGKVFVVAIKPQRTRSESTQPRQYFVGIFRPDGQLLREISAQPDRTVQAGIRNGDPTYTNPAMGTPNDSTIETGSTHLGPDGFIYSMRRMREAVINVFSESGDVIRTIRVKPPADDFYATWFQVAQGAIAVYFRPSGNGSGVYVIVDSSTGERLAAFDGAGFSQAFACFSNPYRFTVISTTSQGQLTAKILEPAR